MFRHAFVVLTKTGTSSKIQTFWIVRAAKSCKISQFKEIINKKNIIIIIVVIITINFIMIMIIMMMMMMIIIILKHLLKI